MGGTSRVGIAEPEELNAPRRTRGRWHDRPDVVHLALWFLGVVVASLLIFLAPIAHGIDTGRAETMRALLSHGDLFLVGAVVGIGSCADLLTALVLHEGAGRWALWKGVALITSILLVYINAEWYGDLSAKLTNGSSALSSSTLEAVSIVIFLCSFVTSFSCVVLAVAGKKPMEAE